MAMVESVKTVFALSSAPGRAGVAVVRLSGPAAGSALVAIGGRVDRPRVATVSRLIDPRTGAALDQALTLWFPGPSSFTGEDVAEIHVHGGRAVIDGVLGALSRLDGLEPAGPGDFSRRAFAHGKLDLTAVEGLADLIAAETEAQRVQALRQADGALGKLYDGWRDRLVRSRAYVEAEIDFVDEDLPEALTSSERGAIAALADDIVGHLGDQNRGERLRDGFKVVIAGPPNAGKSSLLNALVQREAAIVAPEPGTTRDVIEVALDLGGYPVLLSDTAGLRAPIGEIEAEGIRRARERMEAGDLVIWLRDASLGLAAPVADAEIATPLIAVWSKVDLAPTPLPGLAISVRVGSGLGELIAEIIKRVGSVLGGTAGPAPSRARHRQALERTSLALGRALSCGETSNELVAEELRIAMDELGRLTGRVDVEDLLDVIFADFCIGK